MVWIREALFRCYSLHTAVYSRDPKYKVMWSRLCIDDIAVVAAIFAL